MRDLIMYMKGAKHIIGRVYGKLSTHPLAQELDNNP